MSSSNNICHLLMTIFVQCLMLTNIQICDASDSPNPKPLFIESQDKVSDFFEICTRRSTLTCPVSSPEDSVRLKQVKEKLRKQVEYYTSKTGFVIPCSYLAVIFLLMTHLIIVKHFDWRTLPIVNIFYDIEQDQDKTSGVKFDQYIWMKYLVLRGNHAVFKGRDIRKITWYKYTREEVFDYASVKIHRFEFLDKKSLTKHLADDTERDHQGDMDFSHGGGKNPFDAC